MSLVVKSPDTPTVLANLYSHYTPDIWFAEAVNPRLRGEIITCRYTDDFVCAFRFREDAERFYRKLPKRLEKFGLQVPPDKTQTYRFSRFHPTMRRRFTFLGFEFYWELNRKGVARVKRRTSRKNLRDITRNFTGWIQSKRHIAERKFFQVINAKLRGHYNYYGVRGYSQSIWEYYYRVLEICFKWLNRRSQRRGHKWERFKRSLKVLWYLETKNHRKERSTACRSSILILTEASTTEEPREGKLHAGIGSGATGNRCPCRNVLEKN